MISRRLSRRAVPCVVALLTAGCVATQQADRPLPPLFELPDFQLVDQNGQPFGKQQLLGHVSVANFIFTRCGSTCPLQTANLARLQRSLTAEPKWAHVRFVSISVDPDYDTPEVLTEYARKANADFDHWSFLTGGREAIWRLSEQGFKLGAGAAPNLAVGPIFHSDKFILVDAQARVRGYYDGTAAETLGGLQTDLKRLVDEAFSGDANDD